MDDAGRMKPSVISIGIRMLLTCGYCCLSNPHWNGQGYNGLYQQAGFQSTHVCVSYMIVHSWTINK